jgi:hypothetical protein
LWRALLESGKFICLKINALYQVNLEQFTGAEKTRTIFSAAFNWEGANDGKMKLTPMDVGFSRMQRAPPMTHISHSCRQYIAVYFQFFDQIVQKQILG